MSVKNLMISRGYFIKKNWLWVNAKRIKSAGIFIVFLVFLLMIMIFFKNTLYSDYSRDITVADFKRNICMLSEAAGVIESERINNSSFSEIYPYGSDGTILTADDIIEDLKIALVKFADVDADGMMSGEEIQNLKMMRLEPRIYERELENLQYVNLSMDCNLNNYIIITQGKEAGTVLYNGCLKYVDSANKRYWGLELFNLCHSFYFVFEVV